MHFSISRFFSGLFEELIEKGNSLSPASNEVERVYANHKWKLSSLNLLKKTLGIESDYYKSFREKSKRINMQGHLIFRIVCMESAKEEIEKGFLYKIENLVSSDIFDSIFEHADHLLSKGYKDPDAILGRVIIEKTLKKVAVCKLILMLCFCSNASTVSCAVYPRPQSSTIL